MEILSRIRTKNPVEIIIQIAAILAVAVGPLLVAVAMAAGQAQGKDRQKNQRQKTNHLNSK
jgi:hypothetical protein